MSRKTILKSFMLLVLAINFSASAESQQDKKYRQAVAKCKMDRPGGSGVPVSKGNET
jgi:hypothetical protein